MADMNCPYCGAGCEVCHDDGHGYTEDERHAHFCGSCEKEFVFETSIVLYYKAFEADCLNTGEHDWQPSFTTPIEYTKGVCSKCWKERPATPDDMAKAVAHREKLGEPHDH